ncbi:carboxypeptidase-like regulatory domain-containing protein [Pedobacter gandavensis]|uniref:carboxypeptidase-like regulatory domain-containing protein n=1 Tax=Pedobacter gandavensis TaxID=2679963 RepID=UPI00292E945B|nr:carboxypeptidase-like regulatory domain-containing protein [Pedobacter gandavensis]
MVNNDWLDIGVLEDYLDGKLDAKTMNKVEREALDDPFVAEALAGLSASPKRSLASISLLQKQLKERVAEHHVAKKTKVITWQRLSIAATAAVLFISVSIIFWMKEAARENQLAKQEKEVEVSIQPESTQLAGPSAPKAAQSIASAGAAADATTPSAASAADVVAKDAVVAKALKEAKRNSYAVNTKKKAKAAVSTDEAAAVTTNTEAITTEAANRVAAVMAAPINADASRMAKTSDLNEVMVVRGIQGKVASTDGTPVAGAKVTVIRGYAVVPAITDSNGAFKIPVDSLTKNYTLAVTHPGFAPNTLVARLNAPVEVKLRKQIMIGSAFNPVVGWEKYNQYLAENNRLTKENTLGATVQLSFLIGKDGKPYDFKILRSPGDQYNKEAIRLISEGPKWELPLSPEARVQLGVKF